MSKVFIADKSAVRSKSLKSATKVTALKASKLSKSLEATTE